MHLRTLLFCFLVLPGVAGCFHATIDTGRAPNGIQIERRWASSWIYGLVPPTTIETAAKCPGGMAKIETKLGFLNQVVAALTIGIYTPMEIVVSCADADSNLHEASTVSAGPTAAQRTSAVQVAAETARETGEPVYVRFKTAR